jgi:hypothetical protein
MISNNLPENSIGHCPPNTSLRLMRRSDLKRMQYFPTFIDYLQIILK